MERQAALRDELVRARSQTDKLFALLAPEAIYSRPIAERHRLIFYLGHFDAFDWNLLAARRLNAGSLHPEFDKLFERGIDPEPGQAPSDKPSDWPAVPEVCRYLGGTRQWIDSHLDELDENVLQMAVEHRQMHAETFAYLLHNLPENLKRGSAEKLDTQRAAPPNPMIEVAAGRVQLGVSADQYGWDNEREAHEVFVAAFSISKFKVTNGAYLEFVREGGPVPNFWREQNGEWLLRGMFGEAPLPLDHPVWVTWSQASAFARWRGAALPSEAQFVHASKLFPADAARDNFDFGRWGTVPVDSGLEAMNGRTPLQMTGNGWEWTGDVFAPFEGFTPHPYYPGYSADFFDGKHFVLKGASPRTAHLLTRSSFRNWYRAEYPYMYAAFRLVKG